MQVTAAEICVPDWSRPLRAIYPVLCMASICMAVVLPQAPYARGQDGASHVVQDTQFPGTAPRRIPDPGLVIYDNDSARESVRLAQFRAARAKALAKDSDTLVKLATELDAEVGGGGAKRFGDAQLRKVSKIAKLAHNIEENMKLTYIPVRPSPIVIPDPSLGGSRRTH